MKERIREWLGQDEPFKRFEGFFTAPISSRSAVIPDLDVLHTRQMEAESLDLTKTQDIQAWWKLRKRPAIAVRLLEGLCEVHPS